MAVQPFGITPDVHHSAGEFIYDYNLSSLQRTGGLSCKIRGHSGHLSLPHQVGIAVVIRCRL
jgi:hypothetical protein